MSDTKRPEGPQELRDRVAAGYAEIVTLGGCCGCGCGTTPASISRAVGYLDDDLSTLPAGADQGLGCGAPVGFAALRPGETVLDLGSGPGMDAFLAARAVGPTGHVIGVDMTDAMLHKAEQNAREGGYQNVEFRKGLIEELPLADAAVDVILSNCVINLSPEKDRVFREAARVLCPGGRMVVSDIVLDSPLPPEIASRLDATLGCVGNASVRDDYLALARVAGFRSIRVHKDISYGAVLGPDTPFIAEASRELALSPAQIAQRLGGIRSLTLELRKDHRTKETMSH